METGVFCIYSKTYEKHFIVVEDCIMVKKICSNYKIDNDEFVEILQQYNAEITGGVIYFETKEGAQPFIEKLLSIVTMYKLREA